MSTIEQIFKTLEVSVTQLLKFAESQTIESPTNMQKQTIESHGPLHMQQSTSESQNGHVHGHTVTAESRFIEPVPNSFKQVRSVETQTQADCSAIVAVNTQSYEMRTSRRLLHCCCLTPRPIQWTASSLARMAKNTELGTRPRTTWTNPS